MTRFDRAAAYRLFTALVVTGASIGALSVHADDVRITLDVTYSSGVGSPGTWSLMGRIDATPGGVSGEFGLSAVRFFLTEIDFGIAGEAILLSPGLGAIDPINPGRPSERSPAVLRSDGVIDLIYGQDLSESDGNTLVFGVGVLEESVLATGTFSAGMSPGFGRDSSSPGAATTQALFLPAGSTPITSGALLPDRTLTRVVDNVSVTGDYTGDGLVDAADYTAWRDQLGSTAILTADGDGDRVVDADDYLVWKESYASSSGALATPEPTAWSLAMLGAAFGAIRRGNGLTRRRLSKSGDAC
jgi:hypothetical protein